MRTAACCILFALAVCLMTQCRAIAQAGAGMQPRPEIQAILDRCATAINGNQFAEGLKLSDEALALARRLGDRCGEAVALRFKGVAQANAGEQKKAQTTWEESAAIARAAGYKLGEARAQRNLAELYTESGQPAKAVEAVRQAATLFHDIGAKQEEANAIYRIGFLRLWKLNQRAESVECFNESLKLAREVKDRELEASSLGCLGNAYWMGGEPQRALEFYQQGLPIVRSLGDKNAEAKSFTNIALCYSDAGRIREAIALYEQALPLLRDSGDVPNEVRTLTNLGGAYRAIGRARKALDYLAPALKLARSPQGQPWMAAGALNLSALCDMDLGENAKALGDLQKALAICRESGDRRTEGSVLGNLGQAYADTGARAQALDCYRRALALLRASGDKQNEIGALNGLAALYLATGQPQKAQELYTHSLALTRETKDRRIEGRVLIYLGMTCADQGTIRQALEYYRKALAIAESLQDDRGRQGALNQFGAVYLAQGLPKKALEFFTAALAITRALGDPVEEAKELQNLGAARLSLGESEKALGYLVEALGMIRRNGSRRDESIALANIGDFYLSLTQMENARRYYSEALKIERALGDKSYYRRGLNRMGLTYVGNSHDPYDLRTALTYLRLSYEMCIREGDTQGAASVQSNMAVIYTRLGEYPRALQCCQGALDRMHRSGDTHAEPAALSNLGTVYAALRHPDMALRYYRRALSMMRAAGDHENETNTLANMGELFADRNRLGQAEQCLRQAVLVTESTRAKLGSLTEAKIAFQGHRSEIYEALLEVLMRRGKHVELFSVQQKMKARALMDAVGVGGSRSLSERLTDGEREQLAAARARADGFSKRMVAEGVRNEVGGKRRFIELKEQLRKAELEVMRLADGLTARHPDPAQRAATITLTAKDAARLLEPGTVLLEYSVLECWPDGSQPLDSAIVTVVSHGGIITACRLPVSSSRLRTLAAEFRAACSDPRRSYRPQARKLYDLLLAPIAKLIAGAKRIVVCPDGALWDVPLAVLQDPRGKALIEKVELAQEYSATGLSIAARATSEKRGRAQRSAMVVADPDFGGSARFGDSPELPGQRPIDAPARPIDAPSRPVESPSRTLPSPVAELLGARGKGLGSLPGTRREAQAIRATFPDAMACLGGEATEERVKKEACEYRYLHFATHGFYNEAAPLLSCLLLAQPPAGSAEDGFLTAREIMELKLSADMVVLSACNTARGAKRTGEGIVGLTWALFAAGIPTQVVSQWAVDDASTATLMESFYGRLKAGEPKVSALRTAALRLRGDGKHSHPYYWAPFVLMGQW